MPQDTSVTRIVQLAATISESVANIEDILSSQGVETPSFTADAPKSFPKEINSARDAVIDATAELHDLLLEPLILIFKHGAHNNSACLQAISRFNIASLVPDGGQVSYAEIARQTPLSELTVKRLLRHAITMRVFRETEAGLVAHTSASKFMTIPFVNDWVRTGTGEMYPAASKLVDALEKWPESAETNETAFSMANNTSQSAYEILGSDPVRAGRFANAMQVYTIRPEYDPSFIVDHYDWASLGSAHVVDIGGSQGHIAVKLAQHYGNLTFSVQDMDKVVEGAEDGVPADLRGRIRFMAWDFFATQTVEADVYFFRWIFHNWSDKYCIKILRAQIPALRPGAKIVIQDVMMPEPGAIPLWKEKDLRAGDLNMAAAFNSRERSLSEWKDLLAEADPRFVVKRVIEPEGSALGIIEAFWER